MLASRCLGLSRGHKIAWRSYVRRATPADAVAWLTLRAAPDVQRVPSGARGESRTLTGLPPGDFESPASAIPPLGRVFARTNLAAGAAQRHPHGCPSATADSCLAVATTDERSRGAARHRAGAPDAPSCVAPPTRLRGRPTPSVPVVPAARRSPSDPSACAVRRATWCP